MYYVNKNTGKKPVENTFQGMEINGNNTKKTDDIREKTALKSLLIMLITCGLIFPKNHYVK